MNYPTPAVCPDRYAMLQGVVGSSGGGEATQTYLFFEEFDGITLCYSGEASVCNNTWWYITAGDITFAEGSLTIATGQYVVQAYTEEDTVYAALKMNWPSGANNTLFNIQDASGNTLCNTLIYTNLFYVQNTGGSNAGGTDTLTVDTDYYIKIKAEKGTGSNAKCTGYWSTTGQSGSWTQYTSSNGSWSAQAGRLFINTSIVKSVRISTSDINW